MSLIMNIRGTNGSGKSTVIFRLMDQAKKVFPVDLAPYKTPKGVLRQVEGTVLEDLGVVIVGPYHTQCGGCDAIKTQDLVKEAVRKAASFNLKTVVFEGVLVSTIFKGYLELSRSLVKEGHSYLWGYLDTPVETCLARIQARNGGKPIKEKLVHDKVRSIKNTYYKARSVSENVLIDDQDRFVQIALEGKL